MVRPRGHQQRSAPGLIPGVPQFSAVRGAGGESRSLLLLGRTLEQMALRLQGWTTALAQSFKGYGPEQCLWLSSREAAPQFPALILELGQPKPVSGTVTDFKEPVQRTGITSKQRKKHRRGGRGRPPDPEDGLAARAESPSSPQSKVGPEKELMESKRNKREETLHNHFEISKTVVLLVLGFRRGKTDPKNLGNEGKRSYQGS